VLLFMKLDFGVPKLLDFSSPILKLMDGLDS
jgi:hypothetical protein